jgi:hypothetical protein
MKCRAGSKSNAARRCAGVVGAAAPWRWLVVGLRDSTNENPNLMLKLPPRSMIASSVRVLRPD